MDESDEWWDCHISHFVVACRQVRCPLSDAGFHDSQPALEPFKRKCCPEWRTPVSYRRYVCSNHHFNTPCHYSSCMAATRKLSIVTWNVWFDAFESSRRFSHIFHLMDQYHPDIMLFQEVTPHFLQILQKQPWIDAYDCSDDFSGSTVDPYGVLTLSKKSLDCKFQFIPLPSNMERQLLICRTRSLDLNVVIGNVHLESLANSVLRENNFKYVLKPSSKTQIGFLVEILIFAATKISLEMVH